MRILALLLSLASCESRHGEPENLHGVFDSSATASAPAASASAQPTRQPLARLNPTASAAAGEPPVPPSSRRKPVPGPCLGLAGEAAKPAERPAKRPACRHRAEILEDRDPDGTPRYACVFAPEAIEKRSPLPLVVFFHGQDESPAKVAKETLLRSLTGELDLSGAAEHKGFVIAAPQARRIGSHTAFDVGFTSLDNADVIATERFIAVLSARGYVDRERVYAFGNGTGGEMAAMWAMLRSDRVAAFASYAGNAARFRWSCDGDPTPAAVIYRACDSVTPCLDIEQWLQLRDQSRGPTLSLRLDAASGSEPACNLDASSCKRDKGMANHHRWPKGKEREVLEYLGRFRLDLR